MQVRRPGIGRIARGGRRQTIGRCAAGYSFGAFDSARPDPFVTHMVAALRGAGKAGMYRSSQLPRAVADRQERRVRRHARYLHGVADQIIARRRADGPGHHDDLLETMLAPGLAGQSVLDEANIRYQLLNFLIAGHETTSGALSFALYFLARHPEVLAKARTEIDAVWGPAQWPEFEQISRLRYLRAVLDETLRLQPTVAAYYRQARADTVLAGRYRVRQGQWALAQVATLHRDPRWTGAGLAPVDRFDPDRFAPERIKARPGHLYKPFGTGARSCIGRQFALHEAVLVLGVLIRRYDLIAEPDYRLRFSARLTVMPKGFRLRLRRR